MTRDDVDDYDNMYNDDACSGRCFRQDKEVMLGKVTPPIPLQCAGLFMKLRDTQGLPVNACSPKMTHCSKSLSVNETSLLCFYQGCSCFLG